MSSFTDLAVALHGAATREAFGAEQLEIWAARSDEPVFKITLAEVRRTGACIGEAYELIRALIPHERTIRDLIAAAERRDAA